MGPTQGEKRLVSNWELSVCEPEVGKKGRLSFPNKSSASVSLPGMNLVLEMLPFGCCASLITGLDALHSAWAFLSSVFGDSWASLCLPWL